MARPPDPWYWKARDGWYVTVNGRRILLAKGKTSKSEAMKEFHRLMLADGVPSGPTRAPTVAEICDLFLEAAHVRLKVGTLKPLTVEFYSRHLQAFCDRCGGLDATAIKPFQVDRWLAETGWGRSTRHGAITSIKAAFRWAVRQTYLKVNPLENLEKPGIERRESVLNEDQFRTILGGVKDAAFRDYLTVLWETGARPGEVSKVSAKEVRLSHRVWVFPARVSKTGGKTGKPRIVYLNDSALELTRRAADAHPDGPIFVNARGRPWTRNALACRFARIRKKYGFGGEATAYALRHRFATDGLIRGVDLAVMAELLGHSDTTMISRVYSHLAEASEHLSDAAKKVRPNES